MMKNTEDKCQPTISSCKLRHSVSVNGKKKSHFTGKFCIGCKLCRYSDF